MIGTNLVDNLGGIAFWRNLSLWAYSLKTLLKTREPQICVDPRSTWLGWQHAAGCVIAGPLWKSGVPQGRPPFCFCGRPLPWRRCAFRDGLAQRPAALCSARYWQTSPFLRLARLARIAQRRSWFPRGSCMSQCVMSQFGMLGST